MNIEEERKAFEKALPLPEYHFIDNPEYYKSYRDGQFAVWIAAKANASEMAKPAVRICPYRKNKFKVIDSFNERLGVGETYDDCLQWVIAQGYRVID